ncbi:hypothetical protein COY05_03105 [Candidatus Peregrinibacteria bacterium CG_4_10_14_0_2_um_filter_38_24]|nr:MAG: hypothetical protein COY05_03105 [Candidatus Peregrinibacteria bacterium CG_4_10_14_0_2_um_filter_38_24]PJC38629.1 MAG: hypothetical protein CO044_04035 [Candidatus Peregrinibacteria bacterium CG_4_9_14_0_2_um_filter_38_9]
MDLIFFGMQGAGKGTLGKQLSEKYGFQIFETGGELRKLSNEDSELGKKVKSIITAGHLVSNEVVMEIVENFLDHLTPGVNVLFDGIPRKIEQANSLNALLEKHERKYKAVLIDIKKETALKRLTTRRICGKCKSVYPADYQKSTCSACGGELTTRADDNSEAIKTRLSAFENETVPAINLYNEKLIKINGELTIDEVFKLAIETLDPILK